MSFFFGSNVDKESLCPIKAKKIYTVIKKRGFNMTSNLPDDFVFYLTETKEFKREEGEQAPSPCSYGGADVNWSASTDYRVIMKIDPRFFVTTVTEYHGISTKTGSTGGHSGAEGCQCHSVGGSYTGNFDGKAKLIYVNEGPKVGDYHEFKWEGEYTHDNDCSKAPERGEVNRPFTAFFEMPIPTSYEDEFTYQKLEELGNELLENCSFNDFDWGKQREVKYVADEDATISIDCGNPEFIFKNTIYNEDGDEMEEKDDCSPCSGLLASATTRKLTVEFYTDWREEEKRTWIQKAKAQFIPSSNYYWKIFVPQLIYHIYNNPANEKPQERRKDFPIVCELVKAVPGKRINIDPPKEPGHFVIMNCAKVVDLSKAQLDIAEGKYAGCVEKINFPEILRDI